VICPETKPRPPCRHVDLLAPAEWTALGALDEGDPHLPDLLALLRAEADGCHRCACPIEARLAESPAAATAAFLVLSYIAMDYWDGRPLAAIGRDSAFGRAIWAVERRLEVAVTAGAGRDELPAACNEGILAVLEPRTASYRRQILRELIALVRVGRRGTVEDDRSAPGV
jgi:hypothetical protein